MLSSSLPPQYLLSSVSFSKLSLIILSLYFLYLPKSYRSIYLLSPAFPQIFRHSFLLNSFHLSSIHTTCCTFDPRISLATDLPALASPWFLKRYLTHSVISLAMWKGSYQPNPSTISISLGHSSITFFPLAITFDLLHTHSYLSLSYDSSLFKSPTSLPFDNFVIRFFRSLLN